MHCPVLRCDYCREEFAITKTTFYLCKLKNYLSTHCLFCPVHPPTLQDNLECVSSLMSCCMGLENDRKMFLCVCVRLCTHPSSHPGGAESEECSEMPFLDWDLGLITNRWVLHFSRRSVTHVEHFHIKANTALHYTDTHISLFITATILSVM